MTEKIIDKLKELVFYGIILCIFIVVITGKTADLKRISQSATEDEALLALDQFAAR